MIASLTLCYQYNICTIYLLALLRSDEAEVKEELQTVQQS